MKESRLQRTGARQRGTGAIAHCTGILTRAAALLAVGVLALQPALGVQAATKTTNKAATTAGATTTAAAPQFRHWTDDIYYLVGSSSGTQLGAYAKGVDIIDGYYKELGTLSNYELLVAQHTDGTNSLAFRQSTINNMQSIHEQCQAWCAAAMPVIVPQGTSLQDALTKCAVWIADYMTYDQAATNDVALANYYQNALVGFATGKGVCATYSTMFDTMVTYLPFNSQNMTVDYTNAAPTHIDTRYVSSAAHGWSAVNLGTSWVMYDVTNYDNMDGVRQPQYLGVPLSIVSQ